MMAKKNHARYNAVLFTNRLFAPDVPFGSARIPQKITPTRPKNLADVERERETGQAPEEGATNHRSNCSSVRNDVSPSTLGSTPRPASGSIPGEVSTGVFLISLLPSAYIVEKTNSPSAWRSAKITTEYFRCPA